jgi:ABC-type transport system involved in multi-copper enzyme maturation permease subunit
MLYMAPEEADRLYSSLYIFFSTNIVKFFAAIICIALTSGAVSAEWERGTLSTILSKPISRFSLYLGKWLGIVSFGILSILLWDAVIFSVAHYRAPDETHSGVLTAFPYLLLYPVTFTSIALFFSTFGAFPLASGLTVLLTGIGWAEGTFYLLDKAFEVHALESLSRIAGYIMPIGRMSRTVSDGMGELPGFAPYASYTSGTKGIITGGVFGTIVNGPFDFPYVLLYTLAFFIAGAIIFSRKDI